MKTFKRLFCAIISVIMILSSLFTVGVFAEEDAVNFTDVAENNPYYDAIYSLARDGVVNGIKQDDGTLAFKPDETITRAEVATLIAIALVKDESLLTSTTDKFPDVPQEHWANKYIAYAVQTGIVAGNDDGTFRPANPVTYGEVCKMLVCAKGYGEVYEATTPWYEGYVNIANKINITKNALSTGDKEASRGIVAQLIYNMEGIQYYQPKTQPSVGGGGGGGGGRVSKDVEKENEDVKGVVTAVFETNLTGEELGLTYKQMMIDDVVYNIGDYTLDRLYNYLGKRVDAEYSETASGKKTLEKIEVSSRNKTVTINAQDFVSVSAGDGERKIIYYPPGENKNHTAILSSELSVIYNGYPVIKDAVTNEFISEYLDIECGSIELINNNVDDEYDVAIVSRYVVYFPTSRTTSESSYTITDGNFNKSVVLNSDDCIISEVTAIKGVASEAKMSAIATNKVVAVATPYDRTEGTYVIVSSAKTNDSAEVDAISDEYITINNKEYKQSAYFKRLLETENSKNFKLEVGTKGTFYFDHKGNLAYFKKAERKEPYAYVMGFDDGEGLDGDCSIYMYTISGSTVTPKVFAFRDTVKVNGQNKKPSELGSILKANADVINAKSLANEAKILNGDYSQLVRYKSSTITINGESVPCLTEIYTITPDDLDDGDVVPGLFRTGKEGEKTAFTDGKNRLKYVKKSNAFQDESGSNQFTVNNSTVVLLIPDDRINEKEYKKNTYSYFSNGTKYDVEPYDIKSDVAGVVLVYTRGVSTAATIAVNAKVAFVENVSLRQNSEGKTVQMLSYYLSGETTLKTMLTEKDTTIPTEVKPGDLIRFAYEQGPEEKNVTEKTSVLTGIQRVFVGGQLYDWKAGSVFETFPAEGNVIGHTHNSTSDYYQVVHGTLHSKSIDGGVGSINVVPVIVDNKDDYQGNWMPYKITASTKLYKWDSEEDKFVIADVTYLQSVEDANGDPTSASRLVVIKNDTNNIAQAIYVLG